MPNLQGTGPVGRDDGDRLNEARATEKSMPGLATSWGEGVLGAG